jgi:hypothetical protein
VILKTEIKYFTNKLLEVCRLSQNIIHVKPQIHGGVVQASRGCGIPVGPRSRKPGRDKIYEENRFLGKNAKNV